MIKSGREEKNNITQLVRGTWVLVVVTFMLFLGGLATLWVTKNKMEDQVTEMRRSTDLAWRPFLNISMDTLFFDFSYDLSGVDGDTLGRRPMDSININSDAYLAVKRMLCLFGNSVRFWNSGPTPLRIVRYRVKGLSRHAWAEVCNKSPETFVEHLREMEDFDLLEIDMVVLPNDTLDIPYNLRGIVSFPLSDFESYKDRHLPLPMYSYAYVEYEDFFDNSYNSLLIHLYQFAIRIEEGIARFAPRKFADGRFLMIVEKMRWDIDIRD